MHNRRPTVTRRQFLQGLSMLGGAGAVYHGLTTLGLFQIPEASAAVRCSQIPDIGSDAGKGKSVIVLGAGAAGLCSAYLLVRNGFQVTLIEANPRYGGRSFTIRQGDTLQETGGPVQTCAFTHKDLYFNAGPGRIPQHHAVVLEYCRRFKVQLEPYIFLSEANRLQNDTIFAGKPVQFRQIQGNLRGHLSELLAKVTQQGELDKELSQIDREKFLEMLSNFGALKRQPNGTFVYRIPPANLSESYSNAGYRVEPGAYLDHGEPFENVSLEDIIASGFWGGQNQELFAHLQYYWQTSLMQPVGGMDMIWRGFCKQLALNPDDRTNLRQAVGDLVAWRGRPVTSVRHTAHGVEVQHSDEHGGDVRRETADFCISTMAPIQLLRVGNGFSTAFANALADIPYMPACKVGWQTTKRFWETDDGIYGGISWTKHIINQIWYPSSGYQSDTGVLTATYNRGPDALQFGNLALNEHFRLALEGGKKLHPGNYEHNIMRHTALGVAWQHMPYFIGGWPNETFEERPRSYERLNMLNPHERLYLAGDYLSYWPGWQEGALTAANCAYATLHDRVRQS